MLLVCLPFLSGLAALIYEVLWFRRLGLVFGNTVEAAATVMTAYMVGLAVGAHVAGRRAGAIRRPGRVFGQLELAIGLFALAVPALLSLSRVVYVAFYPLVPAGSPWLTLIRFVMSLAVLLLPTCCMGATLPVLSRAVLARRDAFGGRLGVLYGMNTAGAVCGTLLAGFVLVPRLGLHGTNAVAMTLSVLVGATAILMSRRPVAPSTPEPDSGATPQRPRQPAVLLVAIALAGFLALAFEVAWFRTLILVFGSTTYSFTIMLAVFLLGLSLGALLLGWLSDRALRPMALFAGALVLIGAFTLVSLHGFTRAPQWFLRYLGHAGLQWRAVLAAKSAIAGAFLLVPAIGFGAAFTAGTRAVRETVTDSPRAVGAAYMANTLAAALGAVVTGFALLPWLGIEATLVSLGRGALAVGSLAILLIPVSRRVKWVNRHVALALLVGAAVAPMPGWDHQILASGPYFAPWNFLQPGAPGLREKIASERLLHYSEGKTAVVAVICGADEKLYFSMDGKVEADTTPRSMVLQRMMGHLPMLFHPEPKRVLNIGFGAGVTLGALNCYPVEHIEVVDIEPRVREAAQTWGARNHYVASDARVKLTVNDGRNHLLATRERYDVIASDPFEPVVAGAASLYTVEHFAQARNCLHPHGLMCQYLPLYELSHADFETILRSFVTVFPRCAVFFTGCDTILLGARDELQLDMGRVQSRIADPVVQESLREVGFATPASILGMLVVESDDAIVWVGPGRLNTDTCPVIEFSAPRSAMRYTSDENQRMLDKVFAPLPRAVLETLSAEAQDQARRTRRALRGVLDASLSRARGDGPEAGTAKLEQAVADAPQSPIARNELVATQVALASRDIAQGRSEAAGARLLQALIVEPQSFWALYYLARLALQTENTVAAEPYVSRGLAAYPRSPLFTAARAQLRGMEGDAQGAAVDLWQALEKLPRRAELWDDYAACLEALDEPDAAARAVRRAAEVRRWAGAHP